MMMYLDSSMSGEPQIRANILRHVFGLQDLSKQQVTSYLMQTDLMCNVLDQVVSACESGSCGMSDSKQKWDLCVLDGAFQLLAANQGMPKRVRVEVEQLFDLKTWTDCVIRGLVSACACMDKLGDDFQYIVFTPMGWLELLLNVGDAAFRQWVFDEQFESLFKMLTILGEAFVKRHDRFLKVEAYWKTMYGFLKIFQVSPCLESFSSKLFHFIVSF
jgi:hypothetical protein